MKRKLATIMVLLSICILGNSGVLQIMAEDTEFCDVEDTVVSMNLSAVDVETGNSEIYSYDVLEGGVTVVSSFIYCFNSAAYLSSISDSDLAKNEYVNFVCFGSYFDNQDALKDFISDYGSFECGFKYYEDVNHIANKYEGCTNVEGNTYPFVYIIVEENGKNVIKYAHSGYVSASTLEEKITNIMMDKKAGWNEVVGLKYYFYNDGTPAVGFTEIDGETYYFSDKGKMIIGCVSVGDDYYWFDDDGSLGTGWHTTDKCYDHDDNRVYYDEKTTYYKDGKGAEGLTVIDGETYYFDEYSEMQTGEVDIDGTYYWFDEDGTLGSGWHEVGSDNRRKFYDENGKCVCNQIVDEHYLDCYGNIETNRFVIQDIEGEYYPYLQDYNIVDGAYYYTHKNGVIYLDIDTLRYFDEDGNMVKNQFICGGTYTYFFQADGSPMVSRLTYHPDGEHVIYFDENGREVFDDFANVKMSITGESVDDYCYFGALGYLYVDVVTYDKEGKNLYYANPYGVLERDRWFQFSDTVTCADGTPWNGAAGNFGYANADGTLAVNIWLYDWRGQLCYLQGNGVALY